MSIPEYQLDTWSKQGSVTGSSGTYNAIKNVLEATNTPYADKDFSVFLQGSYGNDTNIYAESDVDILVVMPAGNTINQAAKIRWEVPAPFPMDVIVRTPKDLKWRLAEGESFHTEILTKGKTLYEKGHSRVGAKCRGRLSRSRKGRSRERFTP